MSNEGETQEGVKKFNVEWKGRPIEELSHEELLDFAVWCANELRAVDSLLAWVGSHLSSGLIRREAANRWGASHPGSPANRLAEAIKATKGGQDENKG